NAPTPPNNSFREAFNVRPSANVQIVVNGNAPTTLPGDSLNLILDNTITAIQFTPGVGPGAGRFDFPNTRKAVPFTGIETVVGLSVTATSVQTGPTLPGQVGTFTVVSSGTIQGVQLIGGITGGTVPANPFVISPQPVNPFQPFGAGRVAFGD